MKDSMIYMRKTRVTSIRVGEPGTSSRDRDVDSNFPAGR